MSNITIPAGTGYVSKNYRYTQDGPKIEYTPVETKSLTIIRDDDTAAREAEFMRTHVSRYVLPGKLAAAQKKGAATVPVPTADLTRLLARVGEHVAPVAAVEAPAVPAKLEALPAELSALMEWDNDGEAIVSRKQIEALIAQAARIGHATPRTPAKRKTTATLTETVAAAIAAEKRSVSIAVAELDRMLETVNAERIAERAAGQEVAA